MKLFSLYLVELRRLLLSKRIWFASILCLCTPLLGYSVYKVSSNEDVAVNAYIANPVIAAAMAGAVILAFVTITEMERQYHSGTEAMTYSAVSPVTLACARVMAFMTISSVLTVICSFLYLPYTMFKMEYLFSMGFYFENYAIFILPTWWISILFAEGFYQITGRIELTGILYTLLVFFSFSRLSPFSFRQWISPWIVTYSDGFESLWPLRLGFYTRMMWLCFAIGLWLFSLLCLRKYQKNLINSFLWGMKKVYILLFSAVFILVGAFLLKYQPFIDHGPEEYIRLENKSWMDGNTELAGRIASEHFSIVAHPILGTVSGRAEYNLSYSKEVEAYLKLNPGYKIKNMTYGGEEVEFKTIDDDINGLRTTYFSLPEAINRTLIVEYGGMPTNERYSVAGVDHTVDKEYISLNNRSLAPHMEDMFIWLNADVSVDITIPDNLTPYLNYSIMTDFTDNQDGSRTWTRNWSNNSSSWTYLQEFTAGRYVTDKVTAADIEIDFTYGEIYRDVVKEYDAAQAIADVFDYCTAHYGGFGFELDGRLLFQQKSSMLMGGYALRGVSTWFEWVLAPDTLSDSDKGASSKEVFIHEMIHQWWGDIFGSDDGNELWSSEGLTVYSTYRFVKEKYGELYAKQYYVEDWVRSVEEQNRNFYNRHPEYLDMLPEHYQVRLRISNRGINLYKRMPLMILKAEELVGGEEKMDEILNQIYEDRFEYQPGHFAFQDFLEYCGLTEEDLRLE